MIARLWWKEARQVWPAWAFLAATGLAIQAFAAWYWGAAAKPAGYLGAALVITFMYVFLIAAATFAGEREGGTLGLLDALPVERWRVWAAKAGFAVGTAALLGAVLWAGAKLFGSLDVEEWANGVGVGLMWGASAMGWGLFWSAILGNALFAAVAAMASLGVSLALLANLQVGPSTTESSPWLLALSLLTTAASAWIFHLGGPPRWQPARRARPTSPSPAEAIAERARAIEAERPLKRVWTAAAPRLIWKTVREVRADLWMLAVLALATAAAPYTLTWRVTDAVPLTVAGMVVLAILTGVAAFSVENRRGTQRFLLRHAARPGVVWAVKTAVWWGVSVLLWAVAAAPYWLYWMSTSPPAANARFPFREVFWGLGGLTIAFATALLCGMVFRRGIMAGSMALVACLALAGLIGFLTYAQVAFPWHWSYVAVAILAVGWAWSGDWLLDRPGLARWGRLAAYLAAVPAVLVPAYIGSRSWAVPSLPAANADAIFEPSRFTSPAPEDDNAAPLYLQAGKVLAANAPSKELAADLQKAGEADWDSIPAGAAEWLERIEPALALLIEGSTKTTCKYVDPRKETLFDRPEEPRAGELAQALTASALARLGRGDLDGSWAEIEAMLRIAQQYSHANSPLGTFAFDSRATSLALRWAADPRQTARSLEKAARGWREIPPWMSPADRVRADAVVFHNTLALPRDELAEKLFMAHAGMRRKASAAEKLMFDLRTTPWEIARARKVYDLLAAAKMQAFRRGVAPYESWTPALYAAAPWTPVWLDARSGLRVEEQGMQLVLSPQELAELAGTTPLVREASGFGQAFDWRQAMEARNETFRRALSLVLNLRLYQARHDGALPATLAHLPPDAEGDAPTAATPEERLDPYNGKPFGYVPSQGQRLLPIGSMEATRVNDVDDPRMKPTEGFKLLYSVGPDGVDDRAARNVNNFSKGDYVFPLKDGVKPPPDAP